mmetsp:Transcript_3719/g.8500  ORF Transcript_3719/g.8500 Transcript_3719/m.8500 type:complete len:225 (-) Transcript_3719:141-815(-)
MATQYTSYLPACWPWMRFSGGAYVGSREMSLTPIPVEMSHDDPKSMSFRGSPPPVTMMFSGLMSRWITPTSCICAHATRSSPITRVQRSGLASPPSRAPSFPDRSLPSSSMSSIDSPASLLNIRPMFSRSPGRSPGWNPMSPRYLATRGLGVRASFSFTAFSVWKMDAANFLLTALLTGTLTTTCPPMPIIPCFPKYTLPNVPWASGCCQFAETSLLENLGGWA